MKKNNTNARVGKMKKKIKLMKVMLWQKNEKNKSNVRVRKMK